MVGLSAFTSLKNFTYSLLYYFLNSYQTLAGARKSLVGVRKNNLPKFFLGGKALFLGGMPPFFEKVVHCTTFL